MLAYLVMYMQVGMRTQTRTEIAIQSIFCVVAPLPIFSQLKPFRLITMDDPPMTSTLLQVRYSCKSEDPMKNSTDTQSSF